MGCDVVRSELSVANMATGSVATVATANASGGVCAISPDKSRIVYEIGGMVSGALYSTTISATR